MSPDSARFSIEVSPLLMASVDRCLKAGQQAAAVRRRAQEELLPGLVRVISCAFEMRADLKEERRARGGKMESKSSFDLACLPKMVTGEACPLWKVRSMLILFVGMGSALDAVPESAQALVVERMLRTCGVVVPRGSPVVLDGTAGTMVRFIWQDVEMAVVLGSAPQVGFADEFVFDPGSVRIVSFDGTLQRSRTDLVAEMAAKGDALAEPARVRERM